MRLGQQGRRPARGPGSGGLALAPGPENASHDWDRHYGTVNQQMSPESSSREYASTSAVIRAKVPALSEFHGRKPVVVCVPAEIVQLSAVRLVMHHRSVPVLWDVESFVQPVHAVVVNGRSTGFAERPIGHGRFRVVRQPPHLDVALRCGPPHPSSCPHCRRRSRVRNHLGPGHQGRGTSVPAGPTRGRGWVRRCGGWARRSNRVGRVRHSRRTGGRSNGSSCSRGPFPGRDTGPGIEAGRPPVSRLSAPGGCAPHRRAELPADAGFGGHQLHRGADEVGDNRVEADVELLLGVAVGLRPGRCVPGA
ncbi:hypothetical protein OV450_7976 [Actinobacteria bacterium OV450]|nr:hypothetical protein OV450_7976 [Actinobacteria bacterium OV450]